MSSIFDWEIKLKTGTEEISATEPTDTGTEIIFNLEGGGSKTYKKEDVISTTAIGVRPFGL